MEKNKKQEAFPLSDGEKQFLISWRKGVAENKIIMTPEEHGAHIKQIWPKIIGTAEKARDEGRIVKISIESETRQITKEESEDGIPGVVATGFHFITIVLGPKGMLGNRIKKQK